jgi:hypothetical protein
VYGDTTATMAVVASGIPASIIEKTEKTTTPGNPTPRITRGYEGTVSSLVQVTDADRLQDERTGQIYVITAVSQSALPGMVTDITLTLRRAT